MDMITGGLDATALVLEANKKIKAGEDEVTMLKVEEEADKMGLNVYKQGYANEDITVSGDTTDYTYEKDKTLGTYRHQDFTHSSENLRQAITDNIVFKLRESGTEIDEKLQLKIEKRIDMKLDPHFGKLEQLVIKRSSEAIDTAIQNEADRLMGTVREDSRSKLPLSEKYQIQMGSFINHVKHQVDNDVITPEHGQKWIDKVQREYSTQITESFLKSGKPEDLEKFKALQGTELYKDVPPLKKIQFNSEYLKDKDSLKQQELLNLALETISDTNNNYEGSGGHLLLDEVLGPKNWTFDEKTGKANIINLELKRGKEKRRFQDGEWREVDNVVISEFKGINNTNLRSIVNSAVSRLESDWKKKTTLNNDESKLLQQEIATYQDQVTENFVHGFGGTLGDGMDMKPNDMQVPRNFVGVNTVWNGKKVDKSYPFMAESVQNLNLLLTESQNKVNSFLEFQSSKKDIQKHLLQLKEKIGSIKNYTIRGVGSSYLTKIQQKLSQRISLSDTVNRGKPNFLNLWFKQKIPASVRATLSMGTDQFDAYKEQALSAHMIYVGLDPNSRTDKTKHRRRYKQIRQPYGYLKKQKVEKE